MATERTVLVRLKAEVNPFVRGMAEAAGAVKGLTHEINTTNDRTAWLTQGILALAPAIVPLGAAAVPVISGIATQMTVGAAAAGVLALGFHGIGNALKALNAYQLEPTAANLLKLHQTMQTLSASGRDFVRFLDGLQSFGSSLSHTAQAGMFPGITDGLQQLVVLGPQVTRIVHQIAEGIGQLADEAGKGIATSPTFRAFFDFLEHDAKPILIEMGHTLGNFAEGLTRIFLDFIPESEKFSTGLLHISQRFNQWAQELDKTQGFQDFLAYVDKSGPQALDFMDALVTALIAIVHAAAPVGNIMLPAFTEVLKVFADLADTQLGSVLIALAAAMSVYGRAVAIGSNLTTGMNRGFGMASSEAIKTAFSFRQLTTDILTYVRAARAGEAASAGMAESQAAAAVGIRKWGGAAARVGGQAALLGVAASGVADKFHLGNTASLAMAGSLAGPWGAAIGAGVGLVLDFAGSQHQSAAATADFTSTLNQQTGAITENTKAMAAKALQDDGALDQAKSLGLSLDLVTKAAVGNKAALAEVNGQLAFFLNQQKPGYSAGGVSVVDPSQQAAARDLMKELGLVNNRVSDGQAKTRQLSEALGHNTSITERTAQAHKVLAAQLKAEKQAASQSVSQWDALGKSVDDTKVSLDRWIRDMQKTANALAGFGQNALKAAHKGLDQGLIKSLEAAGPAGALRMKQLADASQSEIARANHSWESFQHATNTAMGNLARATGRKYNVNVDTSAALAALQHMQYAIDQLHGKTVMIRTTGGRSVQSYDTGGFTGWGGHFEPAGVVHRNELVLPEHVVKADWGYLKSRYGYLPGFSEGGLVGMSLGATPQGAGSGGSNVNVNLGMETLPISGQLDIDSGRFVGTMRVIARQEIDADKDFDAKRGGQ